MNLRQVWNEFFTKPAGRLILFLLVGGIFLAFILLRQGSRPKPDNRRVTETTAATTATGYTFTQDIPATTSTKVPPSKVEREALPKVAPMQKSPPPIPQTIFATKDQSLGDSFLPFGRLLKCELVNTVDSTNLATPIIGLIIEDAWHDGRLIIPAGTEVHGGAQKSAVRERIGSDRQWVLVFQDGRELPVSGTVLDYAPDPDRPDQWKETDGSAGLRGFLVKSDKFAEAKAMLATMISAGAAAFPQTTNIISPLTGSATEITQGGFSDAFSAGIAAGGDLYAKRLLEQLDKDPYYVRVPGGTTFYLYVSQTVDLDKATFGLSSVTPANPSQQP